MDTMAKIPIYKIAGPDGKEITIIDFNRSQKEKLIRILEEAYRSNPEYRLFKDELKRERERERFERLLKKDKGYLYVRDPISNRYRIHKVKPLKELVKEFEKEPNMDNWIKIYERFLQLTRPPLYFENAKISLKNLFQLW